MAKEKRKLNEIPKAYAKGETTDLYTEVKFELGKRVPIDENDPDRGNKVVGTGVFATQRWYAGTEAGVRAMAEEYGWDYVADKANYGANLDFRQNQRPGSGAGKKVARQAAVAKILSDPTSPIFAEYVALLNSNDPDKVQEWLDARIEAES